MKRLILTTALLLGFFATQASRADEELAFASNGITLSGTLVLPRETSPIATVVLIHGSGPQERMMGLARAFASREIAVLTYDKRGVGLSGGVYEGRNNVSSANLDLLASDAAAALDTAVKHDGLRAIPAGFVGISQAGWIAPLAALKSANVKFVALFSGPVTTVSEEDHFSKLAENKPDFWATHSAEQVRNHMKTVRPWAADVDPRDSIVQLKIPALWLFGGRDNSVPVDLSITRLEGLIERGQSNLSYKVFSAYGHELVEKRGDPAFDEMLNWILAVILKSKNMGPS